MIFIGRQFSVAESYRCKNICVRHIFDGLACCLFSEVQHVARSTGSSLEKPISLELGVPLAGVPSRVLGCDPHRGAPLRYVLCARNGRYGSEAVACREGDAWQNVAAAAAARMRGPDGFMMFRLDAAAATTLQVGCSSQAARTASPLLLHTVWHAIQVAHGPNPQL